MVSRSTTVQSLLAQQQRNLLPGVRIKAVLLSAGEHAAEEGRCQERSQGRSPEGQGAEG